MKRRSAFFLCAVLILTLCSCAQPGESDPTATQQTPTEQPENTAETVEPTVFSYVPEDLLGEDMNPFYDVEFPEKYTVYMAEYEGSAYRFYYLCLTAEGTAEDVVTYLSQLVGDDAEESITENLSRLNDGFVSINGTQTDHGLNADVTIEPTDPEAGEYAYVDGFDIRLMTSVSDDLAEQLHALMTENIASTLFESYGIAETLNSHETVWRTFKLRLYNGIVQAECAYSPGEDYDDWKNSVISNGQLFVQGEQASIQYGDLYVQFIFDDVEQTVYLGQSLSETDQNIGSYEAPLSLTTLGFQNTAGDFGNCGYGDVDSDLYIRVSKTEWGAEEDSIWGNGHSVDGTYAEYLVTYYPLENRYNVQVAGEGPWANYDYNPTDHSVVPMDTAETEAEIRDRMGDITGLSEDSAIKASVTFFDDYIMNTFGMSADELFALSAD